MGFPYYISHIPVVFVLALYLFIVYKNKEYWKNNEWLFILFSTLLFFVVRINDFLPRITSLDESQWIVCAQSIEDDFWNWLENFYYNDFTRILTILPLYGLGKITGQITCLESTFLVNLFLSIFLFLQYCIVRIISPNKDVAIFGYSFFLVVLALGCQMDFFVYNSEMPAITLISFVLLLLAKIYFSDKPSNLLIFLIGFSASMIPFAKEQAILIALFLFFSAFSLLVNVKKVKGILYLTLGGILGSSFFLIPLFIYNDWKEMVSIFQIDAEYASQGFSPAANEVKKFISIEIIINWMKQVFNPVLIFPVAVFVIMVFLSLFKIGGLKTQIGKWVIFYFSFFLVVLLSILPPKNFGLLHYTIFLFPIAFMAISWAIERLILNKRALILFMVFSFFTDVFPSSRRSIFSVKGYKEVSVQMEKAHYYNALKFRTSPGQRLLIWGFGQNVYTPLGLKRSSGYLYPQFAFGESESAHIVRSRFINDIIKQQPDVILEIIGEKAVGFHDTSMYSIKNGHPEMYQIVKKSYTKDYDNDGLVVWIRKKNF